MSPTQVVAHAWQCGLLHTLHRQLARDVLLVDTHSLVLEWVIHDFAEHIRCGAYCNRCTLDAVRISRNSSIVASVWRNAGVSSLTTSATHFRQFLEYALRRLQGGVQDPDVWRAVLTLAPIWYRLTEALQQIVSRRVLNAYAISWCSERQAIHVDDKLQLCQEDLFDFECYLSSQYADDTARVAKFHIPTLRLVIPCIQRGHSSTMFHTDGRRCAFFPPRGRCVVYEDVKGSVYHVLDRNVFDLMNYLGDRLHMDAILTIWSYINFDVAMQNQLLLWIQHMHNAPFLVARQCTFT